MTAGSEDAATAVKRMQMRSWRRGTKEMDMILGPFGDSELVKMSAAEFAEYENLLNENDQDLYRWVSEKETEPPEFAPMLNKIRKFHGL